MGKENAIGFWVGGARETYLAHNDTFSVYYRARTGADVPATMTDAEKTRFLNEAADMEEN